MTILRSLLFNAFFLGGTAVVVLLGVPLLAFPPRVLTGFIRFWACMMIGALRVICGIRLEVMGMENLPPGGSIIAAKHQSAFDTMVWLKLVPNSVYVLKKELLDIPFWGWLARHCGHLSVDRQAGAAALRTLVRETKARLAEGRPVVIFPEGTRTALDGMVKLQRGAANIAVRGERDVTPVLIDCTPRSLTKGLPWWKVPPTRMKFTIEVREDIPVRPFIDEAGGEAALAARRLTDHLRNYFQTEKPAHAGA